MTVTKKKTPAKKTSSKIVTLEDLFSKLENIEILSKMPDKMKLAGFQRQQEAIAREWHEAPEAHADAQLSQKPMQVELMNDKQTGEIIGVIIDVAGSRINIGRDGVVDRQPTISVHSNEKFYRSDEESV